MRAGPEGNLLHNVPVDIVVTIFTENLKLRAYLKGFIRLCFILNLWLSRCMVISNSGKKRKKICIFGVNSFLLKKKIFEQKLAQILETSISLLKLLFPKNEP